MSQAATSVVVYHHYSDTVYLDGRLVITSSGQYGVSVPQLCELLGVRYERRDVSWEDLPCRWEGMHGHIRRAEPPERLADLEAHFAELAARRRRERVAQLRDELARLEAEADPVTVTEANGEGRG